MTKDWQAELLEVHGSVIEIMRSSVRDKDGEKAFCANDAIDALMKMGAPEDVILKSVLLGIFIGLIKLLNDVPTTIHVAEELEDDVFGDEEDEK